MKKFTLICLALFMLLAFAGCKKDADDACAMKLDASTIKSADVIAVMNSFFGKLETIAKDANGDCDKFGDALTMHLNSCNSNLGLAFKSHKLVDEKSPEAEKLGKLMESMDNGEFKKMTDKCKDNSKVGLFQLSMLGVIMSAADDGDKKDDAAADDKKDDAAAPAADDKKDDAAAPAADDKKEDTAAAAE